MTFHLQFSIESYTLTSWIRLCKEFFAHHLNDEIDGCMSNPVLQRFAWFLSVWLEADLLVTQIFTPAIRYLKSLGFRLVIDIQTCNNALRKIFARRRSIKTPKARCSPSAWQMRDRKETELISPSVTRDSVTRKIDTLTLGGVYSYYCQDIQAGWPLTGRDARLTPLVAELIRAQNLWG